MFGETRLAIPYFQQITLHSKIINIQLQNNSHSTPFFEQSMDYFGKFEAECHLLKIRCSKSSFTKYRGVSV
jgi:hypothetical protein